MRRFAILPLLGALLSAAAPRAAAQVHLDGPALLTAAAVLPSPEETRFADIPWIPSLVRGVEEAARVQKPILLWAMNGHPLGCV